jgi:acetolactate synthase-1/2/3 large subunit
MRVADYVFGFVAEKLGCKAVFLVPGGGAMHLNDALAQNRDLAFIPNHHEQASSIAAEAYSRVSEKIGVVLVTTGPGATNAITGVAGAWIESVPLLIISGQVKRADMMGSSGVRQNRDGTNVDPLPSGRGAASCYERAARAGMGRYPARRTGC